MHSPSTISSALAARLLFIVPLILRSSFATITTSIQSGDTFLAIAYSAGIPVESLAAANPGVIATQLYVGQILNVPVNDGTATAVSAPNPVIPDATAATPTTLATSASPPVSSDSLPTGSSPMIPLVCASGSSTVASPSTPASVSSSMMQASPPSSEPASSIATSPTSTEVSPTTPPPSSTEVSPTTSPPSSTEVSPTTSPPSSTEISPTISPPTSTSVSSSIAASPTSTEVSPTTSPPSSTSASSTAQATTPATSTSSSIPPPSTTSSVPPSTPAATSTTPPPPPSSTAPPKVTASTTPNSPPAPVSCNPTPSGKYHDVAGVQKNIGGFCSSAATSELAAVQTGGGVVNGDSQGGNKNHGSTNNEAGYNLTVTAIAGCSIPNAQVMYPFGAAEDLVNCTQILWDTYANCNNNFGMAGSITAGCFIYAFDPDP